MIRRTALALLLAGCLITGACEAAAREVTLFVIDDFTVHDSHGTNVRSILERASARRVDIRSVDVGRSLDREAYFRALRDIEHHVRTNPGAVAVVNLSFGTYEHDRDEAARLDSLTAAGAVVVAAAGNDGTGRTFYPAGYEPVFAVGALDDAGGVASYSNHGPHVRLYAPGHLRDEIVANDLILGPAGSYEHRLTYRFIGGTSFAAPQVAGLVAYLLLEREDLTPREAVEIVRKHARFIPVPPGKPPVSVLDAPAVLAKEDPAFARVLHAKNWIYGVLAILFVVSLVYARGAGMVLVLGAFLWGGSLWVLSRPIIGHYGVVNGTMIVHAAATTGILILAVWNLLAAASDRRREQAERDVAARLQAMLDQISAGEPRDPEPREDRPA